MSSSNNDSSASESSIPRFPERVEAYDDRAFVMSSYLGAKGCWSCVAGTDKSNDVEKEKDAKNAFSVLLRSLRP